MLDYAENVRIRCHINEIWAPIISSAVTMVWRRFNSRTRNGGQICQVSSASTWLVCYSKESGRASRHKTRGGHKTLIVILLNNILFDIGRSSRYDAGKSRPLTSVEASLVDHICNDESERKHLKLLAQCIGFETFPSDISVRDDLTCFSRTEKAPHIVNHRSPTANTIRLACVEIRGVA